MKSPKQFLKQFQAYFSLRKNSADVFLNLGSWKCQEIYEKRVLREREHTFFHAVAREKNLDEELSDLRERRN